MASPGSSDEGEIVESRAGRSKPTSLPKSNGPKVDRIDRTRTANSRSISPDRGQDNKRYNGGSSRRSPSRSRSPRGHKRPRDGRDFPRNGRPDVDPRGSRQLYEDSRSGRGSLAYDDQDRPRSKSPAATLLYDGYGERAQPRSRARDRSRDRYPDKRPRYRSRSPYRPPRGDRGGRARDRDRDRPENSRRNAEPATRSAADRRDGARPRGQESPRPEQLRRNGEGESRREGTHQSKATGTEAQSGVHQTNGNPSSARQTEPEQDFVEEEPVDVDAEIERRRRRREELLTKSRGPTPMLAQALQVSEKAAQSPDPTRASTPVATEGNTPQSAVSSPASPAPVLQEGMSPAALNISDDQDLINHHGESGNVEEDGPSAADYDPTADMREDELRDKLHNGQAGQDAEPAPVIAAPPQLPQKGQDGDDEDDDEFDMFAEDFDEDKFAASKAGQAGPGVDDREGPNGPAKSAAGGILEGADKDGYYKIRIGEIMNGRYQVQSMLGKGMFSGVARAVDITNNNLVAIKMMRNNDALRRGGFTEIAILQKLNEADPDNRKHIVKFERYFEHKGHLCLAFENLSLNLREVLRKFGNNVGINLNATRAYAHQMFVSLAHLRRCSIVHADLKPDNILVNESRNVLKLCDLGTAIDRSDAATAHTEITPYLVSRFYRAPEIILGMPYDYAVDMWSIGCTLYELYTGKILFTGDSNNQMLKAIMEIRGKFSPKLYKRGQLAAMHFDESGNFVSVERDKILDKTSIRTMAIVKPTRDLRTRLMAASGGMTESEARDLNLFVDLLERCLALNPDKRITPAEALKHPFFAQKLALASR